MMVSLKMIVKSLTSPVNVSRLLRLLVHTVQTLTFSIALEYRPWVDAYDAVFIEIHGDMIPPQQRYILGAALEYFINYSLVAGVGRIGLRRLRWRDVN